MTKQFIASLCLLALVGMAVGVGVQGAEEGTVGATVTVESISVSISSDGIVAYGTIGAGDSKNTALYHESTNLDGMNPADTQTVANDGNITVTINIRGTGSDAWTLATTASGATDYSHKFSKDAFDTDGTALTLSNQELASGVISGNSQTFDLEITTPPSATNFTSQSVDVIIQATE